MRTKNLQQYLACALRKCLPLVALTLVCASAFAQPATIVSYWNFNDASNPTQSVAAVGGFVGVFTNDNTTADYATNNPVYTPDGGGFTALPGDRALDFGTNQAYRLMRSTDIAAALNAAAAGDKITITFRQKWTNATIASSSFWLTSPSSGGNWRGFQAHCPYGGTTIYFDTAGCCTAGSQRLSGGIAGNYQLWHLYAFVKNGTTKEIWVDGVKVLSSTGANPFPVDFTEVLVGAAYVMGSPAPGVANNMRGLIDDFTVWQGGLTPTQIALLKNGQTPAQVAADTDGDGMQDWYEDQNSFNKNSAADAAQDADADGLTNYQEYQKGTNPHNPDTDGDGLLDAVETGTGSWISATDTGTNPFDPDTDKDLLPDGVENNTSVFVDAGHTGTSPLNRDTDGDGFGDGAEVPLGSSPVDLVSTPSVGTGARILAYWNFDTNSAPTQAVDRVHSLLAVFTNGLVTLTNGQVVTTNGAVYTADGGGHTTRPGDRAVDLGIESAQRIIISRAIAPYLQAASTFDPVSTIGDQISISFWQKWSVVPVSSSSFWIFSPSAGGNRGLQSHTPNGSGGIVYFDTAGCCANPQQRSQFNSPAGFNWQKWHHLAFIKNGIEKQVWIDGKLMTNSLGASTLPTDFTDLIIGAGYPGYTAQLRGLVDDFAVYGTGLSTNQIEALAYGLSPMDVEQATGDADSDGLPDWWETHFGLNKNSAADAALDGDADGLTNLQEFQRKTDPTLFDSDADGIRDGYETGTGLWVSANDTGTDPLNPDTDGDSLLDGVESNTGTFVSAANTGTSPLLTDSDADLYSDTTEVLLASNPANVSSVPITPGGINLLAYWDFNDASVTNQAVDRIHNFVSAFEGEAAYAGPGAGRTGQADDRAVDMGTNGTSTLRNAAGAWLSAVAPNDAITVSFWEKWTTPVANSFALYGVSPSGSGTDPLRGISTHVPWGDGTVYYDSSGCCTAPANRMSANISTIASSIPTYTSVNGFFVGSWHHVALWKSGGTKQIWIDGFLFLESTGANPMVAGFTQFLLGNDMGAVTGFRGLMDDVAVYGSALDPTNLVALAQGASPIDFSLPIKLRIEPSGTSDVVLSWPGSGFILQTNIDVANPAGWGDVPGVTSSPATNPVSPTGSVYFRLRQQ